MLNFLSFDDIERLSKGLAGSTQQILSRSSRREGKNVFLSHSSKDAKYLPLIIHILENHGGSVYVDVKDDELPKEPSLETARILRSNLRECRKFVLFVTTNSKDSKWIPWELGIGDGEKRPSNVALFPAAPHVWDQQWAKQEYLGLYDRMLWGNFAGSSPEWIVYNHHDNSGVRLSEWLRR